jgi:hypothetical protein
MIFTRILQGFQAQKEKHRYLYSIAISPKTKRSTSSWLGLNTDLAKYFFEMPFPLMSTWALSKITAFLDVQIVQHAVMNISLKITSHNWF